MKLLKTFTHPEFPTPGVPTDSREAARIVLIDENNLCPLIYTSKYDIYCIPGGGIDKGENAKTAAMRESLEETGCSIEIVGEIGKILEKRPAIGYTKKINLEQLSYCFYGKVIGKGEVNFTQNEIDKGFELKWVPVDEVLNYMSTCKPDILKAQLVGARDMFIFQEYLEIKKLA